MKKTIIILLALVPVWGHANSFDEQNCSQAIDNARLAYDNYMLESQKIPAVDEFNSLLKKISTGNYTQDELFLMVKDLMPTLNSHLGIFQKHIELAKEFSRLVDILNQQCTPLDSLHTFEFSNRVSEVNQVQASQKAAMDLLNSFLILANQKLENPDSASNDEL